MMTVDDKLDQIFKELCDIRVILEGLMQPIMILDENGEFGPAQVRVPLDPARSRAFYADGLQHPPDPGSDDD